jgi:hypothetical protein
MAKRVKKTDEQKIRERGDVLLQQLIDVSDSPKDALNVLSYVVAKFIANVSTQGDRLLMEMVVLVRGSLGL